MEGRGPVTLVRLLSGPCQWPSGGGWKQLTCQARAACGCGSSGSSFHLL